MSDAELRHRLYEITELYTGWEVHLQLAAIEELRVEMPHSVVLAQEAVLGEPRTYDFNCHAFSFGLYQQEAFWALRESRHDVLPTGQFVCERVLPAMSEIRLGVARDHDLVLYFDGEELKHSGVVIDQGVESKWGTAHRWRHAALEVPLSFGDTLRCFRAPDAAAVVAAYLEFAGAA